MYMCYSPYSNRFPRMLKCLMLKHRFYLCKITYRKTGCSIIMANDQQHAIPEHGQQGSSDEAAGELLQVFISEPLTLRNQRDPARGSVTFPVHAAHDTRRETLKQTHQPGLWARTHTHTHTHTHSTLALSSRDTFTHSAVNRSAISFFSQALVHFIIALLVRREPAWS